jgi:hypothetical protein
VHNTQPQQTIHDRLAAAAIDPQADVDPLSIRFSEAERSLLGLAPESPVRPGARQLNWVRKLHDYEEFTYRYGRTPRENTRNHTALPAAERRMGEWARYQRRTEDELCTFQKARLDRSAAFEWDPQEAGWEAQLAACILHAKSTGRLPFLNSADPIEFASARWLGRQLRQLQAATLRPNRAIRIKGLLKWGADHLPRQP